MLKQIIAQYFETKRQWELQFYEGTTADESPEWAAFAEAEKQALVYTCSTMEDVREKAQFALDADGVFDQLMNGHYDIDGKEVMALKFFLQSLLGTFEPSDLARLNDLIAKHKFDHAHLLETCGWIDDTGENYRPGSLPAYKAAAQDDEQAFLNLCACPVTSFDARKLKVQYLTEFGICRHGHDNEDTCDALLRSVWEAKRISMPAN